MTDITSDQSWQYGYDTGRAAERARCVAAVEAVKAGHAHAPCDRYGFLIACDAILAAIRGATGGNKKRDPYGGMKEEWEGTDTD